MHTLPDTPPAPSMPPILCILPRYMYKAVDERSKEHFLPCYLGSLQGPLDLQNPQEVPRISALPWLQLGSAPTPMSPLPAPHRCSGWS